MTGHSHRQKRSFTVETHRFLGPNDSLCGHGCGCSALLQPRKQLYAVRTRLHATDLTSTVATFDPTLLHATNTVKTRLL